MATQKGRKFWRGVPGAFVRTHEHSQSRWEKPGIPNVWAKFQGRAINAVRATIEIEK